MPCETDKSTLQELLTDVFEAEKREAINRLHSLEQKILSRLGGNLDEPLVPPIAQSPSTYERSGLPMINEDGNSMQAMEASQLPRSVDFEPPIQKASTKSTQHNAQEKERSRQTFKELTADEHTILRNFSDVISRKVDPHNLAARYAAFFSHKHVPACLSLPVKRLIQAQFFSITITCLIMVNGFMMAIEADDYMGRIVASRNVAMQSGEVVVVQESPLWLYYMDALFAIIFGTEILLRLLVHEFQFWIGEAWIWNWIDTFVVVSAWMEILLSNASSLPPLRLFRLLRVLRSVRVVRALRFFTELRLVLLSLLHSVKPLLWCCLTLVMMLFVFAILFMQLVAASLAEQESGPNSQWADTLMPFFDTCAQSMLSLFAFMAGGDDWHQFYRAFWEMSPSAGIGFVLFIVLMVIGVLNVIAAVFVESAISKAKSDRQLATAEEEAKEQEVAQELINVFHAIDTDVSGYISYDEWTFFNNTDAGRQFLRMFSIDSRRAQALFCSLDLDDTGQIEIDHFVVGFMQLTGAANKIRQHEIEQGLHAQKRMLQSLIGSIDHLKQTRTDVLACMEKLDKHFADFYSRVRMSSEAEQPRVLLIRESTWIPI